MLIPALTRRSLATDLVEALRGQIACGALAPGNKIPTEKELVSSSGVSRTVVREAIARLTAQGFLEPRQGSGVFVMTPPPAAFQVTHDELDDLVGVARLFELRQAVEAEMAGLAAERRSEEDVVVLRKLVTQIERELLMPESPTESDEALHAKIARASGNPYFSRFLEFLEVRLVPRRDLVTDLSDAERSAYFRQVHEEHVALVEAIARCDVDGARAAARSHVENARGQLERFLKRTSAAGERDRARTSARAAA